MIKRYTLPAMGRIWDDESRYAKWLAVELAAAEAQAELGYIPAEIPKEARAKAAFDPARIEAIEAEVHHDVLAFLTNLSETIGPAARYIHHGLTSSDVVDTALSLAMRDAADLLIEDARGLSAALKEQAIKHKHTVTVGRTHGVHAEPTTFGLKLLLWHFEAERNLDRLRGAREVISVGKFSGAVGSYSNIDPEVV